MSPESSDLNRTFRQRLAFKYWSGGKRSAFERDDVWAVEWQLCFEMRLRTWETSNNIVSYQNKDDLQCQSCLRILSKRFSKTIWSDSDFLRQINFKAIRGLIERPWRRLRLISESICLINRRSRWDCQNWKIDRAHSLMFVPGRDSLSQLEHRSCRQCRATCWLGNQKILSLVIKRRGKSANSCFPCLITNHLVSWGDLPVVHRMSLFVHGDFLSLLSCSCALWLPPSGTRLAIGLSVKIDSIPSPTSSSIDNKWKGQSNSLRH